MTNNKVLFQIQTESFKVTKSTRKNKACITQCEIKINEICRKQNKMSLPNQITYSKYFYNSVKKCTL